MFYGLIPFGAWQRALRPQADLLIYGCQVAQGESGTAWLETWQDRLAVDVAASQWPIGGRALGGHDGLEERRGKVETPPLAGMGNWPLLLAQIAVTSTADHGPGTLREAILQSNRTPEDDRISLYAQPRGHRRGEWHRHSPDGFPARFPPGFGH